MVVTIMVVTINVCVSVWRQRAALLLVVILLFPGRPSSAADAETADRLMATVLDSLDVRSIDKNLKAVNAVLKEDRKYVPALLQRALLLKQKESLESDYQAELSLLKALKIDPHHEASGLLLGELLWEQGKWKDAELQFRRVQGDHPESAKAAFMIGTYNLKMFVKYEDMEAIEYLPSSGEYKPWSWASFADEDFKTAVSQFERAIELDPDYRDPYYELGHIYLERERPDSLIQVALRMLVRYPEDPDGLLMLGLGYQRKGDEDRAYTAYAAALKQIDPELRALLESVDLLGSEDDLARIRTADSTSAERFPSEDSRWETAERLRFWRRQDPLYLTEFNERRMEHYGRVAYAILAHSRPGRGIPGWQTDMGRAYIKFGPYKDRYVQRPEIDPNYVGYMLNDYLGTLDIRRVQATNNHVEYWIYDDFAVAFRNWDGLDGWRLDTTYHPGYAVSNGLEVFEVVPPQYDDPYRFRKYDAPFQIAQFRGDTGDTRLELYYALAGEEVAHEGKGPGAHKVDLHQGLFLFDAVWDTVARRVGSVKGLPFVESLLSEDGYLFSGERFELPSGTYHLAAEVRDLKSESIGTLRDLVEVRDFGGPALAVSGVLLASRIVERPNREGRDRYMILPNPMGRIRRDEGASFYFEVYNLNRDEFGQTRYQVSYQIQALSDEDSGEPAEWMTTVSYEHVGNAEWEPQQLRLDLADARPGLRTFRVVVDDLVSGQVAESTARLRVLW